MKNFIFILGFIFILSSCSDSGGDWFAENPVKIKSFKHEKRLTGKLLLDDFYGYEDISCVGEYLVMFASRRENLFFVYNADGDSLGAFGTTGQGPNELLRGAGPCGQTYGTNMLVNDVNGRKICAVDIRESLSRGTCVFSRKIKSTSFAVNSFVMNDSTLVSEQIRSDNFWLLKTNLNTEETSEEKVYKYDVQNVFIQYKSIWRMKPDGSKMASAMQSINMLNILDLRNNGRKSLIVNPPVVSLDDIVTVIKTRSGETTWEKRAYYSGLEVTDKYIYALFKDQASQDDFDRVKKELEIHVFDWDGNPVYKYIIPEYLSCIAVDEIKGRIYGMMRADEQIYVYDIK
jgi:hypothetical protein